MRQIHLNLDDAWACSGPDLTKLPPELTCIDLRAWGPRLRYHGRRDEVDAFYRQLEPQLTPFVLYGSGDFHYLAAIFLRRMKTPVTVISFDNHPDWDIRPPYWSCGGWVNRALEMPQVRRVSIWGCGNYELQFPSRLFANRKALRSGTLEVHPWAERQGRSVRRRFDCMTRQNWRERFERFCESLSGQDVYVTVDLDCLRAEEAVTNWENGLFIAEDVAWAVRRLRQSARLGAGDLCGAYSESEYARGFQRFAARWDHPKTAPVRLEHAREVNLLALGKLWPALIGQPVTDPA